MTNEQLVLLIQAGENIAGNMVQLWEQTKDFISQQARRYRGAAELEDLEQEGFLGLCRAVDNYVPSQEAKFLTYAAFWIKQGMVRYIHDNGSTIRIPSGRLENVRKYQNALEDFRKKYGYEPSEEEISRFYGISVKNIKKLSEAAQMQQTGSLDLCLADDSDTTVGDTVPDPVDLEGSILDDMQQKQLRETLWPLVDDLPGDGPAVIRYRYYDCLTREETGNRLGIIDREQARILENKAIRSLRVKGWRKLAPFREEYISVHTFHGNGVGNFNRTWTSSTERIVLDLL